MSLPPPPSVQIPNKSCGAGSGFGLLKCFLGYLRVCRLFRWICGYLSGHLWLFKWFWWALTGADCFTDTVLTDIGQVVSHL